jgi:Domain of unknown function (DUF4349)
MLLVGIGLSACGRAPAPTGERAMPGIAVRPAALVSDSVQVARLDAKLIRTAELRIRVRNARAAVGRADSIAGRNGGAATDSRLTREDDGRQRADLTLRVPVDDLTSTLDALRSLGVATSEARTEQDVTRAYVDLQTRLAVKEEALSRLRQLLATRTGKLSDVLDVEREITRVVTDIEEMKGEQRYYDDQIALSTVTLTLFEPGALAPAPTMSIAAAFGRAVQVLDTSAGWLVYLLTFLAPWLVVVAIVWRLVRAVRRRRAA